MSFNPIDGHAHFFNLKYLPVETILNQFSGRAVPRAIALSVGKWLKKKTQSSFDQVDKNFVLTPSFSTQSVNELLGSEPLQKIQEMMLTMENPFNITLDSITENLSLQADLEDFQDEEINAGLEEFVLMNPENDPDLINPELEDMHQFMDIDPDMIMKKKSCFKKMLDWVFNALDTVKELPNTIHYHARWFTFMMNKEYDILMWLAGKDGDEEGIKQYINLTMDVTNWFAFKNGDHLPPYFDFETQQLNNMKQLRDMAAEEGIQLYNFVAFDPKRPNGLDIVKKAVDELGFAGVKFYPPMGYRPFYDPTNPDTTVNEKIWWTNIQELFDCCIERGLPVFCHCNNGGFEAKKKKNSGENANPKFWWQLLEEKKYKNLKICLGHAGGGYGWFSPIQTSDIMNPEDIDPKNILDDTGLQEKNWNNSYAAMVYRLCVEYPNVYCDFSYLDEMVPPEGDTDLSEEKPAAEILEIRLKKLFAAQPEFKKKVFYGSDWHMLFREAKNATYYPTYRAFFTKEKFGEEFVADFFEHNVKVFLDIKA